MRTSLFLSILLATYLGLSAPVIGQNPCEQAPVFLSGPTLICAGATTTYTVVQKPGVSFYRWTLDGQEIDYTDLPEVTIEWIGDTTYQLCVEAQCAGGQISPAACTDVTVYELLTEPDPILLCSDDSTYNGLPPGEYKFLFVTPEGCDSTVFLQIEVLGEGPFDLGTIHLCQGDFWTLNGKDYTDPGIYMVKGPLPFSPWCYREMTFRIEPITDSMITIKVIPSKQQKALPTLLTIGMPSGMTPDLNWTGPNGYWSKSKSIAPPEQGLYCLEVRYPFQSDPNQSCTIQHCVDVGYPIPPDSDEEPGGFDPDSRSAMKPRVYPQPATDQFCIAWPGKSVTFGTYTLYDRWGAPVQSGSHDQVCTPLNGLPADVYVLVLTLPDGSVWTTLLTIL